MGTKRDFTSTIDPHSWEGMLNKQIRIPLENLHRNPFRASMPDIEYLAKRTGIPIIVRKFHLWDTTRKQLVENITLAVALLCTRTPYSHVLVFYIDMSGRGGYARFERQKDYDLITPVSIEKLIDELMDSTYSWSTLDLLADQARTLSETMDARLVTS